jgi:ABC-type molybdate transport system substrate-binding protein
MSSLLAALVFVVSAGLAEDQKELTIFCSAGLTDALSEIGRIYENNSNMSVKYFKGAVLCRKIF